MFKAVVQSEVLVLSKDLSVFVQQLSELLHLALLDTVDDLKVWHEVLLELPVGE